MNNYKVFLIILYLVSSKVFALDSKIKGTSYPLSDSLFFQYSITNYTSKDGLPQNSVNCIAKSYNGYLWLATFSGLCRFDGNKFQKINHKELAYERITSLFESSDSSLWIISENNGVGKYKNNRYTKIKKDSTIPNNSYLKIVELSNKKILILAEKIGIGQIHNDSIIIHNNNFFKEEQLLKDRHLIDVKVDSKDQIWLSTARGIYVSSNPYVHYRLIKGSESNDQNEPLYDRSIFIDNHDEVFFSTKYGIKQVDKLNYTSFEISTLTNSMKFSENLIVANDQIWIGTLKNGPVLLNNSQVEHDHQLNLKVQVSDIFIEDDLIWLGTDGNGLYKIHQSKVGGMYSFENQNNIIRSVYLDNKNNLWTGSNNNQLYQFNISNSQNFVWNNLRRSIWSIASDNNNKFWFGTYGKGIYELDLSKSDSLFHLRIDSSIDIGFLALYYDSLKNRLLAGSTTGEVFEYKDSKLTQIFKSKIKGPKITQIRRANDSTIYIATDGEGVYVIQNSEFKKIKKENGLSSNSIRSIYIDEIDNAWIGSTDNGLTLIRNGTYSIINTDHGLYDNLISSINEDKYGYLWFSCNKGVFKVEKSDLISISNKEKSRIFCQVFDESDGMINEETNGGFQPSSCLLDNGLLLYPTLNGIAIFNTLLNDVKPLNQVVIEEFKFGDSIVMFPNKSFDLDPSQRDIVITYSLAYFSNHDKLSFKYQLLGYDNDWRENGSLKNLSYTNLPPGKYKLLISVINEIGNETKMIRPLKFEIHPFWYENKLVYIISFIVVLGIVVFVIYSKRKKLINDKVKLESIVNIRTKELTKEKDIALKNQKKIENQAIELKRLAEVRSKFFSNISHELKTPLTLISGPIESILINEGSLTETSIKDLNLIKNQSNNLAKTINQLLRIARREENNVEINLIEIDFKILLQEVLKKFNESFIQKEIDLISSFKNSNYIGISDPKILNTIISNILSNALKFTPYKGFVKINLLRKENRLIIRISDSGGGIEPKEIPLIFGRYYSSSTVSFQNHDGTGIGLSYANSLTEMLNGKITAYNTNYGACFKIDIPFEHLNPLITTERYNNNSHQDVLVETESVDILNPEIAEKDIPLILIVDDNKEFRDFIARNLMPQFLVLFASNGKVGLDLSIKHQPDLIISDVMMPKLNGLELLKQLKNDPETAHLSILLLTANSSEKIRLKGWNFKADGYLEKPFNLSEFQYIVQSIIHNKKILKHNLSISPFYKESNLKGDYFSKVLEEVIIEGLTDSGFSFANSLDKFDMGMSKFIKTVKIKFNKTPQILLRERRLEYAVELINQRSGNISEIAYASGFNSLGYFSIQFKLHFGLSPSSYFKKIHENFD